MNNKITTQNTSAKSNLSAKGNSDARHVAGSDKENVIISEDGHAGNQHNNNPSDSSLWGKISSLATAAIWIFY